MLGRCACCSPRRPASVTSSRCSRSRARSSPRATTSSGRPGPGARRPRGRGHPGRALRADRRRGRPAARERARAGRGRSPRRTARRTSSRGCSARRSPRRWPPTCCRSPGTGGPTSSSTRTASWPRRWSAPSSGCPASPTRSAVPSLPGTSPRPASGWRRCGPSTGSRCRRTPAASRRPTSTSALPRCGRSRWTTSPTSSRCGRWPTSAGRADPPAPGGAGPPLVYVTMGTVQNRALDLGPLVAALAALPVGSWWPSARTATRTLGASRPTSASSAGSTSPGSCGSAPSWSPTAGRGRSWARWPQGVPQLCLPQAADQFRNAEGGRRAGAALALLPAEISPESVAGPCAGCSTTRRSAARRGVAAEIAAMPSPDERGGAARGAVRPCLGQREATTSPSTGASARSPSATLAVPTIRPSSCQPRTRSVSPGKTTPANFAAKPPTEPGVATEQGVGELAQHDAVGAQAVQDRRREAGRLGERRVGVQRVAVAAQAVEQRLLRGDRVRHVGVGRPVRQHDRLGGAAVAAPAALAPDEDRGPDRPERRRPPRTSPRPPAR